MIQQPPAIPSYLPCYPSTGSAGLVVGSFPSQPRLITGVGSPSGGYHQTTRDQLLLLRSFCLVSFCPFSMFSMFPTMHLDELEKKDEKKDIKRGKALPAEPLLNSHLPALRSMRLTGCLWGSARGRRPTAKGFSPFGRTYAGLISRQDVESHDGFTIINILKAVQWSSWSGHRFLIEESYPTCSPSSNPGWTSFFCRSPV